MKILVLIFLAFNALATDYDQRLDALFKSTDKSFDLECYYYSAKKNLLIEEVNQTVYLNKSLIRDFRITKDNQLFDMRLKVSEHKNENKDKGPIGNYEVTLAGKKFKGTIPKSFYKGFYLINSFSDFDNDFEVNKIYCRVNIAKALPYVFTRTTDRLHINVHPHPTYDWAKETTENVQKIIDSKASKNIILIEEPVDEKGHLVNLKEFLQTGIVPDLPVSKYKSALDIPNDAKLIVSPAGHNRYKFDKKGGELNVLYTGGFHNYCVWNNTRSIISSLFRSNSETTLNLTYKMDSLIVQRVGVIGSLSFNYLMLRKTRLLSKLNVNKPKYMAKYYKKYFKFFSGPFVFGSTYGSFTYAFKTLTINYDNPLYKDSVTYKGAGDRDLTINLKYE